MYVFFFCVSLDIDECAADPVPCDPIAACANTEGSFICTCGVGYDGDGRVDGTGCNSE